MKYETFSKAAPLLAALSSGWCFAFGFVIASVGGSKWPALVGLGIFQGCISVVLQFLRK